MRKNYGSKMPRPVTRPKPKPKPKPRPKPKPKPGLNKPIPPRRRPKNDKVNPNPRKPGRTIPFRSSPY